MNKMDKPDVGGRIRAMRESKALSLRALAELCGLSINAISRIERGESSPTVSSLHKLATALKIPITEFFDDGQAWTTIVVRKGNRARTGSSQMLIESLGTGLPGQRLEPFLMTIQPGACSDEEPISHAGEEFVFCMEGEIDYLVGEEWHRLEAGDSLMFQAEQMHQWKNDGSEQAKVLLVLQASEDEIRVSQQRHLMTRSE